MIPFKKVHEDAIAPSKAHEDDAGYDVRCVEAFKIKAGRRVTVPTGICLDIPKGYYVRIAPKSGLADKKGIDVLAGVVDSGYRDEIRVVLLNTGILDVEFFKGQKIAQIIFEQCFDVEFHKVPKFIGETSRNLGGFGSTGDV